MLVDVFVGSGVLVGVTVGAGVEVGKLVFDGGGVSVGRGVNVLHDAIMKIRAESNNALLMVFIFPHICFDYFLVVENE